MPIVAPAYAPPPPLRQGREVFVLGSGFSRAIAPDVMPTLKPLGRQVAQRFAAARSARVLPDVVVAGLREGVLPIGDLESWLSHLATPAPFLDSAERLMNSATAVELMDMIVNEIEGSEARALAAPMPDWLGRLVTLWDRLEATVVTFNYDMLIEYAVQSAGMPWMTFPGDTIDIFRGLPNAAVGAPPLQAMFSLLKMHGSVGWWSLPGDRIGTTIIRGDLAGQWTDPAPLVGPAGFERFIIPPLAVKTSYLDLGPVRELWRRARSALETASRVVVIGYSSPLTDLATAALLSLHIPKQMLVVVVDPAAEPVIGRLRTLGHEQFEVFDGQDAVARFAASYETSVGPSLAPDLYELLQSAPIGQDDRVVVRTLGGLWAPAVRLLDEDGSPLVIEAGDPTAEFKDLEQAILVRDLRPALLKARESGSAVVMRFPQLPDRIALHLSARVFSTKVLAVEG